MPQKVCCWTHDQFSLSGCGFCSKPPSKIQGNCLSYFCSSLENAQLFVLLACCGWLQADEVIDLEREAPTSSVEEVCHYSLIQDQHARLEVCFPL